MGKLLAALATLVLFSALLAPSAAQNVFFPFGVLAGDLNLTQGDDNFVQISLRNPIHFSSDVFRSLYVNTNGVVSFRRGIHEYRPICEPIDRDNAMITPFWSDVSTSRSGQVSYRESTERSLLDRATQEIRRLSPPPAGFTATSVFITTWNEVPYFGSGTCSKRNSFQLVLASDSTRSFAIFNYNKLEWATAGDCTGAGELPAKSGYDAGDRVTVQGLPGSCTASVLNLVRTSNVGQPGKWIYQVSRP